MMIARKPEDHLKKVMVVDDHPAVREAMRLRMANLPDIEICGEASDVSSAIKIISEVKPDLVLIDISLETGDGLDLIKRIKSRDSKILMLVWSMHDENLYAERSLRAGARGYITKKHATHDILNAIRQVLEGKIYLSPPMRDKLLSRALNGDLNRSPIESLSDRELEVLHLIGQGTRTMEIAKHLHLSVKTIETYRDRIRQKIGLQDGTDLIRFAAQWSLDNRSSTVNPNVH